MTDRQRFAFVSELLIESDRDRRGSEGPFRCPHCTGGLLVRKRGGRYVAEATEEGV